MHLKLNAFEKNLTQEISTLSGYPQAIVREVLEFTFIRQIEQYLATQKMPIPFLGDLTIKFEGDIYVEGEKEAVIETEFEPSQLLKRMVGDIKDGDIPIIKDLLEQKIKPAISNIIND